MTHHYEGSCHCGAVKFSYDGEEITRGLRCTCSICRRKGAMMSPEAIPRENLKIEADPEDLGLYEFGNKVAKHFFASAAASTPITSCSAFRTSAASTSAVSTISIPPTSRSMSSTARI